MTEVIENKDVKTTETTDTKIGLMQHDLIFNNAVGDVLSGKELSPNEVWGDDAVETVLKGQKATETILTDYCQVSIAAANKYFQENADNNKFISPKLTIGDSTFVNKITKSESSGVPVLAMSTKIDNSVPLKAAKAYINELFITAD